MGNLSKTMELTDLIVSEKFDDGINVSKRNEIEDNQIEKAISQCIMDGKRSPTNPLPVAGKGPIELNKNMGLTDLLVRETTFDDGGNFSRRNENSENVVLKVHGNGVKGSQEEADSQIITSQENQDGSLEKIEKKIQNSSTTLKKKKKSNWKYWLRTNGRPHWRFIHY